MVANQNTTALSIIEQVQSDPAVIEAKRRQNEVLAIQQTVFQKGVHYGAPYKGSKNDTLLKPGATFLQQKFQLHEQHERLETTIHVDPDDLSKSYIIIQDRCRIFNSDGQEIAQCDAACTTFEDKYVFRGGGDRICPTCGNPNIMRSQYPPKNNPKAEPGWYCNAKKGGCGANFDYNTPAITDQETAKKRNENPLNLLDTIVAMAQKRAAVRATIKATGVDALFSPGDGVTVDYYDDMDQSNEDLIAVVAKNAPQSNEKALSSDLEGSDHPDIAAPQKTPTEQLAGNGPEQRTIAPQQNGKPGYKDGDLFNAVLKSVYNNNPFHMKGSIKKLNESGALGQWLTLDQAIEVVKNRTPDQEAKDASA